MLIYSSLGGMRAVVYTDVLQFIVLVVGIPLIFIFGVWHLGGWHHFMSKIPAQKNSFSL